MSDKRDKKLLMDRNKKKKNILGFEQVEDEDQKKRYEEEIEKFKPKSDTKKKTIRMTEPKSYEQYKKDEDNSLLSRLGRFVSPAADLAEDVVTGVGKAASKVKEVLTDSYNRATTNRMVKDREKVIQLKNKGKYKGKD